MKLAVGLVLCVLALGCQRDRAGERTLPGSERGDCRPDRSCEAGLICLSNLCVRPPAADCAAVAEQLTSLELGNYAEPEERAPVVQRIADACRAAHVSKDEGACLLRATDRDTAQRCAPALFR